VLFRSKDLSIGEARLQVDWEKRWDATIFQVTGDFVTDYLARVDDRTAVRLEKGEGWFDLRELNLTFTPADFMDVKAGRQVLTWGTGDLFFINDLFPKDWVSFFTGRDEAYLKAPSDAVKTSFYSDAFNVNVVYAPRFDPDRYIDGRRISYYNASLDRIAGRDAVVHSRIPDDWFEDAEASVRVYRNLGGYEAALYGYKGFWKSPAGLEPETGLATFPELWAFGGSVRGNVASGIGNAEAGYYLSEDDRDGEDPFVRNSELRLLVGYEQEAAEDLTVGVQYYLERILQHGAYSRALPPGAKRADEYRHVTALRLTQLLMSQNLKLSLFTFFSPSDADAYLRPIVHYKVNDYFSVEMGANVFLGEDDHTFFGQFEKNTNLYAGFRVSF